MNGQKYEIEIYQLNVTTNTFSRIDVISTYQDLSFFNAVSGTGAAKFSLAIQDPKATITNLTRFRNQVAIKRNGVVVWFGPITDISVSYQNVTGTYSIDCNTYHFHLVDRYTAKLKKYTEQNIADIAIDLLTTVQARTNGGLNINYQSPIPTSVDRAMTYEYKSIATAIQEMSQLVGAFDYNYVPIVDEDNIVTSIQFAMYPNRLGSSRLDLPPIEVGRNIKRITGKTANSIFNSSIAEGAGTGENVPTSTLDYGSSQEGYSRRETILSLKDTSLVETVGLYNTAYLNLYSVEQLALDVDLDQDKVPSFDDLNLGDIIRITSHIGNSEGYLYFTNKQARILQIAVRVDQNGAETITPRLQMIQ